MTRANDVDCVTPCYEASRREANLEDLVHLIDDVDAVIRPAGHPGVRKPWSPDFGFYVGHNIEAT